MTLRDIVLAAIKSAPPAPTQPAPTPAAGVHEDITAASEEVRKHVAAMPPEQRDRIVRLGFLLKVLDPVIGRVYESIQADRGRMNAIESRLAFLEATAQAQAKSARPTRAKRTAP